jgi:carboxylate-amine ligase
LKGSDYTFGIEEEYFLCDASSGALIERMPKDLLATAKSKLAVTVTSEMLQSQIEIASPIFHRADEALAVMARGRLDLAEVVGAFGARIMSAGTHPLGKWHEQRITHRPRYDKLRADFRIIGQRNLVCGLHVHVAVPGDVDRVDVMNRVMPWLPLFLALSTSSPFWDGRDTGLLSYRQSLYDEWPRSGIPDHFADQADYDAFVSLLSQTGAVGDASHLWWAIRPSLKFPTLEMRIADACTDLRDSVAIASLYRALVAALVEDPALGRFRSNHTRRVIDENRWRAKRYGVRAEFIDEKRRSSIPVEGVLRELRERTADWLALQGAEAALAPLERILAKGTSAHEQLRLYDDALAANVDEADALQVVTRWISKQTVAVSELVAPT